MQLSNYLFFTTQCEEALAFNAACGLGHPTIYFRHGDNGMPVYSEHMRGSAHIIVLTDKAKTAEIFQRLSEGSDVTKPLGTQPWGDYFGKLNDRFGVQWMLNCIVS
jgi:PhnB protein